MRKWSSAGVENSIAVPCQPWPACRAHEVGLDASQQRPFCILDEDGRVVAERKAASSPDAIAGALEPFAVTRAELETGPLSVWAMEWRQRGVPIVCTDARHANLMQP